MGLSPFGNCSVYGPTSHRCTCRTEIVERKVFAPNPNPINFKIVAMEQVGKHLVAKIHYPDCKNYEGNKVCVFKDTTMEQLTKRTEIDPHFEMSRHSPCARFRPDFEGWMNAIKFAKEIL